MEPTRTIGAAAAASGLTPRALRLYEKLGLLATGGRTASGYRRYTTADIAALCFIRRCRGLGLSLAEIADIMRTRRAGTTPCGTVRALLDEHVARIDRQVSDLRALREELLRTMTASAAISAPTSSFCPLIEQTATGS